MLAVMKQEMEKLVVDACDDEASKGEVGCDEVVSKLKRSTMKESKMKMR